MTDAPRAARRRARSGLWARCRREVAPLHRRIFVWFGAAILLAGTASWIVAALLAGGDFRRDLEGVQHIVEERFADAWQEPGRRRAFAEEVGQSLRVSLVLRDARGHELDVVGGDCHKPRVVLHPERDGQALGSVAVCTTPRRLQRSIAGALGLASALAVLWLASHKVARHLGKPLRRLAEVADEIGQGRYDTSADVSPRAPEEIRRLAHAIGDMSSKIKQQMGDQRELLASVSHELRSPLARIRLLIELSREEERAAERARMLGELEREIEEIDELVGGLLAGSRLDFSALVLRDHDLVGAAEGALSRAGSPAALDVEGDPRPVRCDATLVARALANLLANAQAHGGGADRILVRFEADRVGVAVLDRGPGFGEGEEERVFARFVRGTSTASSPESLGLGLSLVRRIARAHQGDAYARNREGGGAEVGIWLGASSEPPPSI